MMLLRVSCISDVKQAVGISLWRRHSTSSRLKIAFFGSDDFSVYSLNRLVEYQKRHPDRIESIDVITRSVKATGRRMKTFVDLPVGVFCERHGINVIRADSGREIVDTLRSFRFNTAIAVSYGRLIPWQFIASCAHGGFNVHPSLLPRYSGPSPIQYTLMNDDKTCGVTLQTLHPTKFDGGDILAQSVEMPVEEDETYLTLATKLGKVGGQMLVDFIDREDYADKRPISNAYIPSHAPKLGSDARLVRWSEHTSRNLKRIADALGHIYAYKFVDIEKKNIKENRKVLLYGIKVINFSDDTLKRPGDFTLNSEQNLLIVKTKDGHISVQSLKFQFCSQESPADFMKNIVKRSGNTPFEFE